MPFEVKGNEPLDAKISLRLTASEKIKLKEDAHLAGLTISELVRRRYFGRRIVAHTDEIMIRELRRLGGLLKHIWLESQGVYSRETGQALSEIKAFIRRLSRDRKTH